MSETHVVRVRPLATLRAVLFPQASALTLVALVVAGAALVALSAQVSIPLPFTPVPITGQTFAVVLVGASLGFLAGFASVALYVAAGAAGAPVYADGGSGPLWLATVPHNRMPAVALQDREPVTAGGTAVSLVGDPR